MGGTILIWLRLLLACLGLYTRATNIVRPLGGYERLLSRQTPGTRQLSLSHGSAFIVDETLDGEALVQAIAKTMARHPLLRARIVGTEAQPAWAYCDEDITDLARRVVNNVEAADSSEQFAARWRRELDASLNGAQFPEVGPLWRLVHIPSAPGAAKSALIFTFNHAIDDQKSVNIVVRDLLREYGRSQGAQRQESLPFPPSVEEAVAPGELPTGNTLRWALFQLLNALRGPVMIPQLVAENLRSDPAKYAPLYANPDTRSTFVEPFTLPSSVASGLRTACRARNNTVTSILAAAMLCVTSAAIHNQREEGADNSEGQRGDALLRFLLSVDLRPYGAEKGGSSGSDWARGTVACAAGAVDFDVPVPSALAVYGSPRASAAFSSLAAVDRAALHENLWNLAARCRNDAAEVIQYAKFVPESVRLFGLGMKYANVLQVVELDAKSQDSLGRGYSCGVSNMGLVSFALGEDKINVREAFYGTSHARNGVLCQLSCMTTGAQGKEELCGALQFTDPLITRDQGAEIRRALCDILTEISQT